MAMNRPETTGRKLSGRQQDERLVYTVPEAGRLLGLGRNAAYDAAKRGDIPTLRIGRLLLVPKIPFHRAPKDIRSSADLVSPENFKRILRRRHQMVGGRQNMLNHDLARSLIEVARQWVDADGSTLAELRRLMAKIPVPLPGLTEKNKQALRQFEHPAVLRRLYEFPWRLWGEVNRDGKPDFRTLVKAQAALAVAILCYIPIRLQNLAALSFDVHLFLRESRGAISSLERGEESTRSGLRYSSPRGADADRVSQSHRAKNHRQSPHSTIREYGRVSKNPMDGRVDD
jgi:hypothetical protein